MLYILVLSNNKKRIKKLNEGEYLIVIMFVHACVFIHLYRLVLHNRFTKINFGGFKLLRRKAWESDAQKRINFKTVRNSLTLNAMWRHL